MDLPVGTLYEFTCQRCQLHEDHLNNEPDFGTWKERWEPLRDDTKDLLASVLDGKLPAARLYRRLAEHRSLRFVGEQHGGTWLPAALQLGDRAELWVFVDDEAVASAVREVGARKLGTIAPPGDLATTFAELPDAIGAVWLDPFDARGGLVIERDDLGELRRWARRVLVERALGRTGLQALRSADELWLPVIDGSAATIAETTGDELVVLTAPDAAERFTATIPAGQPVAFVRTVGRELDARIADVRAARGSLSALAVNPNGPAGPVHIPL